jgi:ABC-type dipeptide/oligopeptide/nickel transport system permease subunit
VKSSRLLSQKDKLWLAIWLGGLAALWLWNTAFLNRPAFAQLRAASLNTLLVGVVVVALATLLGWLTAVALHLLEEARRRIPQLLLAFVLNLIRSVPQIVGVLIGYVILTMLIQQEILRNRYVQLLWIALAMSAFVFLEISDLIRERIKHYRSLDFYDAMLSCGISERRIINNEILWKNSRAHLLNKLIAIFGTTIFLLCSIDFIISVGLSTDVSLSNFPITLGGLLAKLDSKQDILAIGAVFTDPSSFPSLFFEHLQGVSTAFTIVFTLLCLYKISNGLVQRLRL